MRAAPRARQRSPAATQLDDMTFGSEPTRDLGRKQSGDTEFNQCKEAMESFLEQELTVEKKDDVLPESSTRTGAAAAFYEVFKREFLGTATDCQSHGIAFQRPRAAKSHP